MANIKSSKKDIRRIEVRTERNRRVKSALKTLRKRADTAVAGGDAAAAAAAVSSYVSELDKAAKRRVIHPNRADRQKAAYARRGKNTGGASEG